MRDIVSKKSNGRTKKLAFGWIDVEKIFAIFRKWHEDVCHVQFDF
jgi:hypothetical protein